LKPRVEQNMRHIVRNTKCRIRHVQCCRGFTLVEMVTALGILALICSSVLVVIDRCVTSATDSSMQMKAFEVARENMEKLLASGSVELSTEFGISEKFPEVKWQNVVEEFYEPITKRMWIQGTCSAEYTDTKGEVQTVELTHWLTAVTKQQMLDILKLKEEQEQSTGQNALTIEEAAEYAGVDVETVQQWVDNGMPTTEDGSFAPDYLDVYNQHDGDPPPEAVEQLPPIEELIEPAEPTEPEEPGEEAPLDQIDPDTGLKPEDLAGLSLEEFWELIIELKKQGKI